MYEKGSHVYQQSVTYACQETHTQWFLRSIAGWRTHTQWRTQKCTNTRMHSHIHTRAHAHTLTHTRIDIQEYECARCLIYTCWNPTHTHTHAHTLTQNNSSSSVRVHVYVREYNISELCVELCVGVCDECICCLIHIRWNSAFNWIIMQSIIAHLRCTYSTSALHLQ